MLLQLEVLAEAPPGQEGSSFNQLLGIKGAARETTAGNFHWNAADVAKLIVCMMMSGPCLTGYTQTINDWYDRIDVINELYHPIPSGAISENEVITQVWVLLFASLGLAGLLDVWAGHNFPIVFYLALKQIGNFALGASYISLPWWAGQALFGTLTPDIVVLTLLYSIAGLGIAIVNDFKSIEGDRKMGLQSLPVAFGPETVKWICVGAIDITQISVAAYLVGAGRPYPAFALLALTIPQIVFQRYTGFMCTTSGFWSNSSLSTTYMKCNPPVYDRENGVLASFFFFISVHVGASAQLFLTLGLLMPALTTSH